MPCGLLRRFSAIFYDSLLLLSLLFFATVILLPFTGGKAIESNNILYSGYLLLCGYVYFTWQWIHGGQTLGMKAWKIIVISNDSKPLDWKSASLRFLLATISLSALGTGFIWALFDPDKLTFHDRYSKTILIKKDKP